jgi:ammonia channel protein AmtB
MLGCVNPADTSWITTAAVLVFMMIIGLALFEAGMLPPRSTAATLAQVSNGTPELLHKSAVQLVRI